MLVLNAQPGRSFILCVENQEIARFTFIDAGNKLRFGIETVSSVEVKKTTVIALDDEQSRHRMVNSLVHVGVTIPEQQVTAAELVEILHRASLPGQIESNGDILVVTEDQPNVRVILETERLSLRFLLTFGWRKHAAEIDKLCLLNTLNQNVSVARFAMPDPATITADQFLPYHGGLSSGQLVSALRVFKENVVQALRRHDMTYLVC